MSKNLVGRTWGSLTSKEQDELLAIARATDGRSTEYKINDTDECIVDFEDISIPGRIKHYEDSNAIEIDNDAVFYNPII